MSQNKEIDFDINSVFNKIGQNLEESILIHVSPLCPFKRTLLVVKSFKSYVQAMMITSNIYVTNLSFSKLQQWVAPFFVSWTSTATTVLGKGRSSSLSPGWKSSGGRGEQRVSVSSTNWNCTYNQVNRKFRLIELCTEHFNIQTLIHVTVKFPPSVLTTCI